MTIDPRAVSTSDLARLLEEQQSLLIDVATGNVRIDDPDVADGFPRLMQ